MELLRKCMQAILSNTKCLSKSVHIVREYNLNLLNHNTNNKVKDFLNNISNSGMTLVIKGPTILEIKSSNSDRSYSHKLFFQKHFLN